MATTSKKIRSRLLARAQKQAAKQAPKQASPAPKQADTGPRVTPMPDETPAWAREGWQPARTGPAVSESLAAWQRAQEWASLRARLHADDGDPYDRRIPAGFNIFGWKL